MSDRVDGVWLRGKWESEARLKIMLLIDNVFQLEEVSVHSSKSTNRVLSGSFQEPIESVSVSALGGSVMKNESPLSCHDRGAKDMERTTTQPLRYDCPIATI